ncbi:hypothetical protein BDR07DRAFT_1321557, partial [Suillus spraguei]
GMDVPDILLVIQWKATCKLATLWQQWGHAVRDHGLQGTAILFAEKSISTMCRKRSISGKRQINTKQRRTKHVQLQDSVPSYIL